MSVVLKFMRGITCFGVMSALCMSSPSCSLPSDLINEFSSSSVPTISRKKPLLPREQRKAIRRQTHARTAFVWREETLYFLNKFFLRATGSAAVVVLPSVRGTRNLLRLERF